MMLPEAGAGSRMTNGRYADGTYAARHPNWHSEHSAWKAQHILRLLQRNRVKPQSICEVGCGAGEILKQLSDLLDPGVQLTGYEISPQAYAMCESRANARLTFRCRDVLLDESLFDVILLIDVIEHLEDYYGFMKAIKRHSRYKILHIPLEMSAQAAVRSDFFRAVYESAGHRHFFNRDTALQALADCGYQVIDSAYTGGAVELPSTSLKMTVARWPRRLLYHLAADFAVRLLGGYSLLVLAE